MSAEDRLREILHSEASAVVPAGDGLALIRERVARRRRLRMLAVPGGALVTTAAVVAVFAFSGQPATQRLDGPTTRPTPTATVTTPTPTPIATPTSTATKGVVAPYTGPALWPFTSVEQGQAWMADPGRRPWAGDSLSVVEHFITDWLKLAGVTASGRGPEVVLRVQGQQVGVVHVVPMFEGGPWTVVSVFGTDLTITEPQAGGAITSPTRVRGRVTGVDESVQVRLTSAPGHPLAETYAPAGGELPWEATLTWTDQTWFTAGVVAITRSPRDGSVSRIAVVVVKRAR